MRKSQVKSLQRKKLKSVHQITPDPEGGPRSPPSRRGSGRAAVNSSKASGWSGGPADLPGPAAPCPPGGALLRTPARSAGVRPAEWPGPPHCGPRRGPLLARTPGLPAPASPLGGQRSPGAFPCISGSLPLPTVPSGCRASPWPFPSPPVPEEMGIWGSDAPSGITGPELS